MVSCGIKKNLPWKTVVPVITGLVKQLYIRNIMHTTPKIHNTVLSEPSVPQLLACLTAPNAAPVVIIISRQLR